ncbi:hypothetical protein [Flagellimonas lutimaris]|uniref:hypothetical protein n=1 Tax=Flagellimonas lutimaris TaxID=475082 RepID=UPI003F5CF320
MKGKRKVMLSRKPIDFKTRFKRSIISQWFYLIFGFLIVLSFYNTYLWILTIILVLTFVIMNYNAMQQYLMKIELDDNDLKIYYLNNKNVEKSIQIPVNELTVDYYGNGIGFSSLVSNHMRIEHNGQTKLKQYQTIGWSLVDLKETTKALKEIKQQIAVY